MRAQFCQGLRDAYLEEVGDEFGGVRQGVPLFKHRLEGAHPGVGERLQVPHPQVPLLGPVQTRLSGDILVAVGLEATRQPKLLPRSKHTPQLGYRRTSPHTAVRLQANIATYRS